MDYLSNVANFRKAIFEKIEKRDSNEFWLKASLKDIKKLLLIQSAPRSGSSLLFFILSKASKICSLSGECAPFYKLNGLSSDVFSSDRIPQELAQKTDNYSDISRDFLSDFSFKGRDCGIINDQSALQRYIDDLALRFAMQWPQIRFSYDIFNRLALEAFRVYSKSFKKFLETEFYLELFKALRTAYPQINPYYYDIPQEAVKKKFPVLRVPLGPPNKIVMIEEPPFILLSPRRKLKREDVFEKIFLLKSSVNSYRMEYIRALFPNAQMKLIYLTRNPLASVNGLYDGWLYNRGFFSHNLKTFFKNNRLGIKSLKIVNYSDRNEWGKWWWNYDLPEGWQDYTKSRLEEVCAFQWISSQRVILQDYKHRKFRFRQFKYEDLIKGPDSLKEELEKMLEFIGLSRDTVKELHLERLPPIQATATPAPRRWKKRKSILLPMLKDSRISELCMMLGYDREKAEAWL